MSLRRSARNVGKEKIEIGAADALYEKAGVNGSKKSASKSKGSSGVPTPSVPPKKTPTARKRKVPSVSEDVSLNSAPDLAIGSSDLVASTGTPEVAQPSPSASNIDPPAVHLPPPSTPAPSKRPRRTKAPSASPTKPIPFTPTPSGVNFIAKPLPAQKAQDDHVLDSLASLNPPAPRPAEPHATNAPVLTPDHTSVVVNNPSLEESPVKTPAKKRKAVLPPDVGVESPLKKGGSTVDTLLRDAEAWLVRVDGEENGKGRLERLIQGKKCAIFSPEGLSEVVDPFTALASGIIGQQVCLPTLVTLSLLR